MKPKSFVKTQVKGAMKISKQHCRKCGEEIKGGVKFCPSCGAQQDFSGVVYSKPRDRAWSAGRIILVVLGSIVLLASFGLLLGGAGISVLRRNISDEDDFLLTPDVDLMVNSYAIVGKGIDIDIDPRSRLWLKVGDLVTLKLVAESNDPTNEIFIGIVEMGSGEVYLRDVWYHQIEELSWEDGPWSDIVNEISFIDHPGDSPSGPPVMQSFWIEHSSGLGVQEIEWSPEASGNYWVVVMNGDGSAVIDVSASVGARVPLLTMIGNVLIIGGVVALLLGGALIYFGIFRRD
jgi:hypothetical protein